MPEFRHNMLTQRLMRIFDWSTSTITNPSTESDEDHTAEADEPPEYQPQYCKQAVPKAVRQSSLLSQALTSPELAPVDSCRYGRESQAISFWSLSGASTAELTSDGGMSSRSHSPSPSPSLSLHTFGRMLLSQKVSTPSKPETDTVQVVGEDDALEGLARKRCIRFACNAPPSRKSSTDDYTTAPVPEQKSKTTLKFACDEPVKTGQPHATTIRFSSSIQTPQQQHAKSPSPSLSSIQAQQIPQSTPMLRAMDSATRFHEFASSCEETESWMIQVPDKTRLLKVDGVLAKEEDIRKLSEEVEAEVRQEEEEAEELNQIAEDDEDDEDVVDEFADCEEEEEEEEEEDEDEEGEEEVEVDNEDEADEEGAEDYLSGNESDNEEGFASDSDDSDASFFDYPRRTGYPLPLFKKPACCHRITPYPLTGFTLDSEQHSINIKLPDTTDFVCGTFDEDKALEDAYACALVEQKRAKYGLTPQDIDPSFPSDASDSESEYHIKSPGSQDHALTRGRMSFSEEEAARGKKVHSILSREKTTNEGKIRFNSPAPQRRVHSPAPKRRIASPPPPTQRGFKVTPPLSRRNSNDHSPRPTMSRRGSRAISPPPPARNVSHLNFTRGHIERTKSLPKGSKLSLKSFGAIHAQETTTETPAIRMRGAIDIVKGLEKKRERRRNKLARQRASYTKKGEGVEKMRELGLMLGKGKQAQWMISV